MEYFLGNDEQNIGKMEQLIIIMISHSRYHFFLLNLSMPTYKLLMFIFSELFVWLVGWLVWFGWLVGGLVGLFVCLCVCVPHVHVFIISVNYVPYLTLFTLRM